MNSQNMLLVRTRKKNARLTAAALCDVNQTINNRWKEWLTEKKSVDC